MRLVLALLLCCSTPALAALDLGQGRGIEFASAADGARLLGSEDDFVRHLSPFDRAARLKSAHPVSEKQYLAFVASNVREWDSDDQAALTAAFDTVHERLARFLPGLPSRVYLVKTSGNEEGGAAYTRGDAVVFPERMMKSARLELAETLSHELFHVLSRSNPALRERLYGVIGFEACPEAVLPPELAPRRITNPDAPRNDHRIRLKFGQQSVWAVPVLYADSAAYDPKRGGEFFDYLRFKMLLSGAPGATVPRLADLKQLEGFDEQVGTNTDYVIHPEEILAVNFSYLVLDKQGLRSPEIPARMRALLDQDAPPPR